MGIHGGNFHGAGSHLDNLPGIPGDSYGNHTHHTRRLGTACRAIAELSSPVAEAAWSQSGRTRLPWTTLEKDTRI